MWGRFSSCGISIFAFQDDHVSFSNITTWSCSFFPFYHCGFFSVPEHKQDALLHTNTSFFYIFQINLFVWNCKSNLWFPEGCLTIKPCVQNVTNSLIVLLYSYAQKEEFREITQSIELNKQQHLCPFLQRSSVFNQVDKPHRDHNEGTGKTFHISLIFTFQLHPEHFSLLFYCCLLCASMTM